MANRIVCDYNKCGKLATHFDFPDTTKHLDLISLDLCNDCKSKLINIFIDYMTWRDEDSVIIKSKPIKDFLEECGVEV